MLGLNKAITRRDFLRGTAYAALAAMFGKGLAGGKEGEKRSKVVLVRHPDALDEDHKPNPEVIARMLDDAVKELTGVDDPVEAWRRIVKPDDLVGIKTNVWAYMPTPKEVEDAIRKRVMDAGVPEERIRMDDRGARRTLADCTALINARPVSYTHLTLPTN